MAEFSIPTAVVRDFVEKNVTSATTQNELTDIDAFAGTDDFDSLIADLGSVFECAYYASLQTEEGRPSVFRIAWSPNAGVEISSPIEPPLTVTPKLLVKSGPVAEGPFQSLVVIGRALVGLRVEDFFRWEQDSFRWLYMTSILEEPSPFFIDVVGPGRLRLSWIDFQIEYHGGQIVSMTPFQRLAPVSDWFKQIQSTMRPKPNESAEVQELIRATWSAVLQKASQRGHGGAFIVSDQLGKNCKLGINLCRSDVLSGALRRGLDVHDKIVKDKVSFDEQDNENYEIAHFQRRDLGKATQFTSSLGNVDGAVVLNRDLEIQGYGAEISIPEAMGEQMILRKSASDESEVQLNDCGMRHRSAASLCMSLPNAIAFVISSDGPLSVFATHNSKVVQYVNLSLSSTEQVTTE